MCLGSIANQVKPPKSLEIKEFLSDSFHQGCYLATQSTVVFHKRNADSFPLYTDKLQNVMPAFEGNSVLLGLL